MDQLVQHQQTINDQLARYGVKFGLYKNGTFQERLFPFDPLPRVITAQEFETLDKGLVQRVNALNLFLKDVYGGKKIIRDGIVPDDFVFAGSGYLPQCEGFVPPKGVYSHISGIDLVQAKDGSWFILEDNLRIPSGASYPLIARELCRRCSPAANFATSIATPFGGLFMLLIFSEGYKKPTGLRICMTISYIFAVCLPGFPRSLRCLPKLLSRHLSLYQYLLHFIPVCSTAMSGTYEPPLLCCKQRQKRGSFCCAQERYS